ncbi:MAG: RnfABCDGE type electron transport complex subunit G [Duncaniella sp.]|uniref:RnfABCDGE type electron transport complex subunit G n=1 Tax=Duncaniella sp. TaxID=2518496 RepID=UPI0023BCB497|nr:RnfABCDGE type electron transport complex subunit G [Duncaniella sp.]MDE5989293.1 RnfABCDGE type electron transport complex subunit G [Duncaniella sp.]MDE6174853.1 RnfABCDGE type electron transport complex subunit G [Duncaniella sp.]
MKSTLVNMVLSLGVITVVAAGALAGVYSATKEPIEQAKAEKQKNAIGEVLPDIQFNNNPAEEAAEVTVDGETVTVFPARQDGELVGLAVESHDSNGFSGNITVMYGFRPDGDITGYAVMQHAETPGLGSKMGEWFCNPAHSIIGLNASTSNLTVSKDGGDVDAITAATISSRAFLRALTLANSASQQFAAGN